MRIEPSPFETYVPSGVEVSLAKAASRRLSSAVKQVPETVRLSVVGATDEKESIEIPASAFQFFIEILVRMAEGQPLRLMPMHAELTTQEAADLLQVSRPYFVGILEEGKIPFRKVGTHCRILIKDLLTFKRVEEEKRNKALEELSALQQELGLDD